MQNADIFFHHIYPQLELEAMGMPMHEELMSEEFDEASCYSTELNVFDYRGDLIARTDIREIIVGGIDKKIQLKAFGYDGDKLYVLSQESAEKIVEEAKLMNEKSGGEFCVKIPIGEEGLKATMELKKLGIKVLMTAIFTPTQALIAAKAGADYVAPYVNRLDNITGDGCEVVAQIVEQFAIHNMQCKVLAASFKNVQQVHNCASAGCQCVTITGDLMEALIKHPMTDAALAGFEKDWTNTYGDKTILDF